METAAVVSISVDELGWLSEQGLPVFLTPPPVVASPAARPFSLQPVCLLSVDSLLTR